MTTLNSSTLSYDMENRLSGYSTGTFVENYAYDEGNRRVEKWSASADNIYPMNRYYSAGYGRFLTVDLFGGSAYLSVLASWNRYRYTLGDPVNATDPLGLEGDDYAGCYINGMWWPGCWLLAQPNPPLVSRAIDRLNNAENAVLNRSSVSAKCQQDLDALSKESGKTIDLTAIQLVLATTTYLNGVGSQVSQSVIFPNSPQAAALVANQTIGDFFSDPSTTVTAVTVLGGSTIYINPGLISSSLRVNEGLLLHEALHELGLVDSDIGVALQSVDPSIQPDSKKNWTNSLQFTTKLTKDCIDGKANKN